MNYLVKTLTDTVFDVQRRYGYSIDPLDVFQILSSAVDAVGESAEILPTLFRNSLERFVETRSELEKGDVNHDQRKRFNFQDYAPTQKVLSM